MPRRSADVPNIPPLERRDALFLVVLRDICRRGNTTTMRDVSAALFVRGFSIHDLKEDLAAFEQRNYVPAGSLFRIQRGYGVVLTSEVDRLCADILQSASDQEGRRCLVALTSGEIEEFYSDAMIRGMISNNDLIVESFDTNIQQASQALRFGFASCALGYQEVPGVDNQHLGDLKRGLLIRDDRALRSVRRGPTSSVAVPRFEPGTRVVVPLPGTFPEVDAWVPPHVARLSINNDVSRRAFAASGVPAIVHARSASSEARVPHTNLHFTDLSEQIGVTPVYLSTRQSLFCAFNDVLRDEIAEL